jgi:hypothetical protein
MTRTSAWTIWIDHPHRFGQGSRGYAPIQESIQLVYGVAITYEGWPWEYHKVSVGPTSHTRAEAIAMALLAMHLRQIREDTRLPWIGECRFDLTQGSDPPEWVLTYERERDARMRADEL